MRFEARDLKSYAEPVSLVDLCEGASYYMVNFADDEMLEPCIETIIYLGRNLREGDGGKVYFQDTYSHAEGVRLATATGADQAHFHQFDDDGLGAIFEFEQALDVLLRCSLRRRGVKN
jgi:hypothetical protein